MKMYHFNPNGHGDEYFVMAENKIKALQYLIQHVKNNHWDNVNALDAKTFPSGYTLDEHAVGQVVHSEIC